MTGTRVIVVDDQAAVRDAFARVVRSQPDLELVGVAADGHEAVELARRTRPHVVVMDVRMPGLDGIAATRELLQGDPSVRVLVVTTFNLDEYVVQALHAGASGFLLKDSAPDQLLAAVRTVARGDAIVDPAATRALIDRFVLATAPPEPAPVDPGLTPRETEVLRLLARGMSNREIAAEMVVTRETVKTYVSRLLAKLGLRDRVQAVLYAHRTGVR